MLQDNYGGVVVRIQDTSPDVKYFGSWQQATVSDDTASGTEASEFGSYCTLVFNGRRRLLSGLHRGADFASCKGTSISLYGYKDDYGTNFLPSSGMYSVDGGDNITFVLETDDSTASKSKSSF
jgi:hypothetical protein